jgi:hypothetical protein
LRNDDHERETLDWLEHVADTGSWQS